VSQPTVLPPESTPQRARLSVASLTARLGAIGGWRRYAGILLLDAILTNVAFFAAFLLRFEGHIPPRNLAQFWSALPWLLAIRLALTFALGLHHWSFRLSGLYEGGRLILANLTGSAIFVTVYYFLQKETENVYLGPPRSVIVIEFLLTTAFMGTLRFSPRLALTWLNEQRIARAGERVRTIIVGAGSTGELLLRDLRRSDEHQYAVVGFVDDNPAKRASSIGGRSVLGSIDDLPRIVVRREIQQLLFAIPRPPAELIRRVLGLCAELKLSYKTLPVSYAYLSDRASASMLQSLAPEDLLPRSAAHFDPSEMRTLVEGRRILVTGAAGSIGSEICRQLAEHRPARLVLSDIDENGLYLLYRDLQRRWPEVSVACEVADIRDSKRLEQLGQEHEPQDVFHAAAHKHVPLMEWAPGEAIKNNVIGCRNVLDMAEGCRAETLVLISSDKAVDPSNVMGATKLIGELLVRARAEVSATRLTAVRFGNVLGSAGSVVPIFKSQIAHGGPVTVTHPECRRFMMTIPEAVGLVILAGLSPFGRLCILEMGEPMRILDLARLMITMAGLVPEKDIQIVFTGLRPGERLDERLMTEEEEKTSYVIRDTIRVVKAPPPAGDLDALIDRLARLAHAGDRSGLLSVLGEFVPAYRSALESRHGLEVARGGRSSRHVPTGAPSSDVARDRF
jgi:FlaA1/EpsC-like NDP-sugar epimerase